MDKVVLYALFGRTIVAYLKNAELEAEMKGALTRMQCGFQSYKSHDGLIDALAKLNRVDAVIVDVPSEMPAGSNLIQRIHQADRHDAPLFFITDENNTGMEDAFFEGVEAILTPPITTETILRSVSFSLSMLTDQSMRQHPRQRLKRARIHYRQSDTGLQSTGYVGDISAGGMFVSSMGDLPKELQPISFKLSFKGEKAEDAIEFEGQGIVKWTRSNLELGRPPGFGVEFKDLSDQSKELAVRLMTSARSRS